MSPHQSADVLDRLLTKADVFVQNLAPGASSAPHVGHAGTSEEPHERQNRAWSWFSVPQFAQTLIGGVYGGRSGEGHPVDCAG